MLLLCVAVPGMTPTTVAAGNLIADGGFEGISAGPKNAGSKIGKWTVGGAAGGTFQLNMPYNGIPAKEGKGAIHIGNSKKAGGVSQSFSTVPGASYKLTFWAVNWPDHGNGTGKVRAHGGEVLLNQPFTAPASPSWKQFSFSFPAKATSTTIKIHNVSGALTIDDVTIVRVAERLIYLKAHCKGPHCPGTDGKYLHSNSPEGGNTSIGGKSADYAWVIEYDKATGVQITAAKTVETGVPTYLKSSDAALYAHAHGGNNVNAHETLHPCPKGNNYPNCQWVTEDSSRLLWLRFYYGSSPQGAAVPQGALLNNEKRAQILGGEMDLARGL